MVVVWSSSTSGDVWRIGCNEWWWNWHLQRIYGNYQFIFENEKSSATLQTLCAQGWPAIPMYILSTVSLGSIIGFFEMANKNSSGLLSISKNQVSQFFWTASVAWSDTDIILAIQCSDIRRSSLFPVLAMCPILLTVFVNLAPGKNHRSNNQTEWTLRIWKSKIWRFCRQIFHTVYRSLR